MRRRPALLLTTAACLALCTPSVGGAVVQQERAVPMLDMPGMMELMQALGPNAVCPRGACGYGRDGIPEPYAGPGWTATMGRRAQAPDGAAFSSSGASLASWMSSSDLLGSPANASDVWGYVSPSGREYAIIGMKEATAFVEVSDAQRPTVVGIARGASSDWRDIKTYRQHAYVVNERGNGLQVIDLSRIDRGRVRVIANVTAGYLRTAHNLLINEDSGYAYLLGSNLGRGGIVVVDLADPARPVVLPDLWDEAYVHDLQVVSYRRGRYAGREIAFAFTGPYGLHIIDVTDKAAMRTLSNLRYENATYGHSGAVDPTLRYLYVNDELDERYNDNVGRLTTYVIRISNLGNPRLMGTVVSDTTAIDHNSMVQGQRLYLSAFRAGMRILDISKPGKPRPIGFFDTHPEDDAARFSGAWGIWAGFPSGNVLVSDVERGLFVVTPD